MNFVEKFIKNQANLYIRDGIIIRSRDSDLVVGSSISLSRIRQLINEMDRVVIENDSVLHLHKFNYIEIPNENGGIKMNQEDQLKEMEDELKGLLLEAQREIIEVMDFEELDLAEQYANEIEETASEMAEEYKKMIEERRFELMHGMPKEQLETIADFVFMKIEENLEPEERVNIPFSLNDTLNGIGRDQSQLNAIYSLSRTISQSHQTNQIDINKLKKLQYRLLGSSFVAGLIGAGLFQLLFK